jgi:hypothetical protein
MYEALEHSALIEGCMAAAAEAWAHEQEAHAARTGVRKEDVSLGLSRNGWAILTPELEKQQEVLWLTQPRLRDTLSFMLDNLYIQNGGTLRRQVKGVPMGLNCSGQMANAYGYAVESRWVDAKKPNGTLFRRYIDDIFVAGPMAMQPGEGLPAEADYKMKYKLTSDSTSSLIYIGVRLFVDEHGQAHTVLHDRAVDYPIQVHRYPEATTVANPAQFGGVIMGRLVAAQRTCSRLDLFQDAVAGILTHAHNRHYPRHLLHSVWTRFLVRYWDAASVTTRELRSWFHKAWSQIVAAPRSTVAGGTTSTQVAAQRTLLSAFPSQQPHPGPTPPNTIPMPIPSWRHTPAR